MSAEVGEPKLAELTHRAAVARLRLADDIEALTYKVSPGNLKQEAKEAGKATLRRWSRAALAAVINHPVSATTALLSVGLAYAALQRRPWKGLEAYRRPMLLLSLLSAPAAVALGARSSREPAPRLLATRQY